MKIVLVISLNILLLFSCNTGTISTRKSLKNSVKETKIKPFKLSIITWESANILAGNKHFIITDTSFTYYKTYNIKDLDSVVILDTLIQKSRLQQIIANSNIAKWKNHYNNENIMITSGSHSSIDYKEGIIKKQCRFDSFNFEPLTKIMKSINLLIHDSKDLQ